MLLIFVAPSTVNGLQQQSLEATVGPEVDIKSTSDGKSPADGTATNLLRSTLETLGNSSSDSLDKLAGGFFDSSAKIVDQLSLTDCHLRNLDLCFAGIMSAIGQRVLPETDSELNVRCDEMRAASQCAIAFASRCNSDRLLDMLAPFSRPLDSQLNELQAPELRKMPERIEELLNNDLLDEAWKFLNASEPQLTQQLTSINGYEMSRICDPKAKNTPKIKLMRHRMFKLGKCVNARLPALSPCLDDAKNAFQLIYEVNNRLEVKGTCCAVGRFRQCASVALDNVCELGSLNQLEASLNKIAGGFMGSLTKVCHIMAPDSEYCITVLPPPGTKAPLRRGRKASRVAKLFEMIKFAPPTSPTL